MTFINQTKELLESGTTLTTASAYSHHEILNVSSVISSLKKKGYHVNRKSIIVNELDGIKVTCYYLKDLNLSTVYWPVKKTSFKRFDKETKKAAFLRFINEYGSITTLQACEELYAFRASGIVYSLKKDGYDLITEMVDVPGRKHKVAQYSLPKEA